MQVICRCYNLPGFLKCITCRLQYTTILSWGRSDELQGSLKMCLRHPVLFLEHTVVWGAAELFQLSKVVLITRDVIHPLTTTLGAVAVRRCLYFCLLTPQAVKKQKQCCSWSIFIYFSLTAHPNNFTLNTARSWFLSNTPAKREVDQINGYQEKDTHTYIHTNRQRCLLL